jgi:hypothetical protein
MTSRLSLRGMMAVLLALMTQLAVGAMVPRVNPLAGVAVLCHPIAPDHGSHAPGLPDLCLLCPFCATMHTPAVVLPAAVALIAEPVVMLVLRSVGVPPARAPPPAFRPPSQPRAPPLNS